MCTFPCQGIPLPHYQATSDTSDSSKGSAHSRPTGFTCNFLPFWKQTHLTSVLWVFQDNGIELTFCRSSLLLHTLTVLNHSRLHARSCERRTAIMSLQWHENLSFEQACWGKCEQLSSYFGLEFMAQSQTFLSRSLINAIFFEWFPHCVRKLIYKGLHRRLERWYLHDQCLSMLLISYPFLSSNFLGITERWVVFISLSPKTAEPRRLVFRF